MSSSHRRYGRIGNWNKFKIGILHIVILLHSVGVSAISSNEKRILHLIAKSTKKYSTPTSITIGTPPQQRQSFLPSCIKDVHLIRGGAGTGAGGDDDSARDIKESIDTEVDVLDDSFDSLILEDLLDGEELLDDDDAGGGTETSASSSLENISEQRQENLTKLQSKIEELKHRQKSFQEKFINDISLTDTTSSSSNSQSSGVNTIERSTINEHSSMDVKNLVRHIFINKVLINFFHYRGDGEIMTNLAVFCSALLGSSLGFVSFLYFIGLGYGVGVALPALFALIAYNVLTDIPIPVLTNLHTFLVFLWGVRLALFLLHREYVNWKEWHTKVVEVNERSKITSKFSVWMSCALFYSSLVSPCLFRLRKEIKRAMMGDAENPALLLSGKKGSSSWGAIGIIGIGIQVVGLLMEAISDIQKASFKASVSSKTGATNRNKWCNQGLWYFFTHPNYLGCVMFWVGTFIAGMGAMDSVMQYIVSSVGLFGVIVIIRGATEQLDLKQSKAYKRNKDYAKFKKRIGFFGPKLY